MGKFGNIMQNPFSKIILGTVQLGMPYGLGPWSNTIMPESEAFAILDAAWEIGITTLDTSPEYGMAEARIAKYLAINPNKNFHIISKIKKIPIVDGYVQSCVENWFITCPFLRMTNCASLSLLLHQEADICREEVVGVLNSAVHKERLSGWGVSVYKSNIARVASNIDNCAMVQLPFSAMNQAFGRDGVIKLLSKQRKIVIARSVFLQGLMLKSEDAFDKLGKQDFEVLRRLMSCLHQRGVSIQDFAISLAIAENGVSNLVLGADTHEQVLSWSMAPRLVNKFDIPVSILNELRVFVSQKTNPQLWKKNAN
jgi:aryl-alcohol dehydrogenase-like predicted oxidoreductase